MSNWFIECLDQAGVGRCEDDGTCEHRLNHGGERVSGTVVAADVSSRPNVAQHRGCVDCRASDYEKDKLIANDGRKRPAMCSLSVRG